MQGRSAGTQKGNYEYSENMGDRCVKGLCNDNENTIINSRGGICQEEKILQFGDFRTSHIPLGLLTCMLQLLT